MKEILVTTGVEESKHLLKVGNIVVIDGYKGCEEIVVRLTEDLLENLFRCIEMGHYKVREATLLEKEYWFTGYNEADIFALPLSALDNFHSYLLINKK